MPEPAPVPHRPGGPRWLAPVLLVAICALAAYSYRSVLALGHCGWDTWPHIAAARVQSPADLLGTFTEELMDGRYPLGHFYRPTTNLAFALDYARAGSDPRAYHHTDVAIVLLAVLALYGLARRHFGSAAAALAAAACFAFHPVHFEALPVSARRADTLSVAFTILAVWAALGRAPLARRRAWAAALAVLLAVSSKETGILALPVVLGARFFAEAREPLGRRLARALREGAPSLAAAALFVLGRTLVLGGLGGHPDSSLLGGLTRLPGLAPLFVRDLLVPQPWSPLAPGALALVLGLGLLAGLACVSVTPAPARASSAPRAVGFVLFWTLCTFAVTGMSGETQTWYGIPMLAPYALLVGWSLGRGVELLLERRLLPGSVGAAAAGVLLVSHLCFSGLVRTYPSWASIDAAVQGFLGRAAESVADLRAGQSAQLAGLPRQLKAAPGTVGVRSASGIEAYGVQAWFDLERPASAGPPVRVVALHWLRRGSAPPPADPDAIVLYVAP